MEQATRPVATILPSTFDTLYQYNVGGRSTIKSSMSPEPTIILPDMDFSSDKIWNLPITTTAPSSRSSLTTDSGGSSGCEDFESMLVAAPMDMTHSYPNQSSIPKDNSSHSWHLVDWMSNNQSPKPRRRAARSETDAERLEKRRKQNRSAQQAYRRRRDELLQEKEREVQRLRTELADARSLNSELCQLVASLRKRIDHV